MRILRCSRSPGDAAFAQHPRDTLVVDPPVVAGQRGVVEFGGDPRRAVSLIGVVHGSNPLGQRVILSAARTSAPSGQA